MPLGLQRHATAPVIGRPMRAAAAAKVSGDAGWPNASAVAGFTVMAMWPPPLQTAGAGRRFSAAAPTAWLLHRPSTVVWNTFCREDRASPMALGGRAKGGDIVAGAWAGSRPRCERPPNRHCRPVDSELQEPLRLQPVLRLHGCRATGAGGGDRLLIMVIGDVAGNEHAWNHAHDSMSGQISLGILWQRIA